LSPTSISPTPPPSPSPPRRRSCWRPSPVWLRCPRVVAVSAPPPEPSSLNPFFVMHRADLLCPRAGRRAFTLVELLTVIAIIGVLAAISIVAVGKVREKSHAARCGANIRQLASIAAIWAQDNSGWTPQARWAAKTLPAHLGATNLRSVGYNDSLGTCGSVDDGITFPPHYGINSELAGADFSSNPTAYYVHGRYKLAQVLTPQTIFFTETKWVSGWS